ncbi:MAG: phosphatidylserine/phosphatidylglycerophosphate/cardiolipin synthase family protein [Gemmatimonadaceae bacterium]|nr:phosphatidylserine/phosphatidylglycerophosphate/cardiolipin synthase family protein [Gemmatimonadaceae bacterium]
MALTRIQVSRLIPGISKAVLFPLGFDAAPESRDPVGAPPNVAQSAVHVAALPQPAGVWLVDNDEAYRAIASAVTAAQTSISISQLAFDANFTVPSIADGVSTPFIDLLLSAASERGVRVRILLNATLLIDTLRPLRQFLATNSPECANLELRGVSCFPSLLHAKIVVVDSKTAFLVGSPFVNGYWDSRLHRPRDTARPMEELGGRPLHDVSVQVSGDPVRNIESFFEELWDVGLRRPPSVAKTLNASVSIDVTAPSGVLPSRSNGATEILRTIEREIANADSLIYLEQQYLSSRRVFAALRDALEREPGLEIIIVSNQNPDITAYAQWQLANFRTFGMIDHPRVGIFALWSAANDSGRLTVNQVFVHSKVVIVDDRCAMCGSANLDGVSLHSYGADFSGIGRRIFHNVRNIDVNLTVCGDDGCSQMSAKSLRHRLWSEHLGADAENMERPDGGWVGLWRESARRNVSSLRSGKAPKNGTFILPFVANSQPSRQLRELGVSEKSGSMELLYNPGSFERRFGLGWVRNMFL